MKKKIFIAIMAMVSCVLASCGDDKNDDPQPNDGEIVITSSWEEKDSVIYLYQQWEDESYMVNATNIYTYSADTLYSYVYKADYGSSSIAKESYNSIKTEHPDVICSCEGSVLTIQYDVKEYRYYTADLVRKMAESFEGRKVYSEDDMEVIN